MEVLKMKRIGLILSCLIFWISGVQASEVVGNAVAVIGSVTVKRMDTGESEILATQSELFLNDTIVTGPDGLAKLLLRDETILKISPNSEVVISSMIAGPDADGRSTVDLLKGRLRSVIGNKLGANTTFDVNTPVAVAGVRGTDFEVVHLFIDGEWVSGVRCYDGAVALSTMGLETQGDVLILPSQYSLVTASSGASNPTEITEGRSLIEVLGIANQGGSNDDIELDALEVQNILLNIEQIDAAVIERVIQTIGLEQINRREQVESEVTEIKEDAQLEIITETINNGTSLEFDIQIPLPAGSE
jgi:hypothetical protein